MNNLLRVLTDGQNNLDPELKQVLTSVKEARRQLHAHDSKISDGFYDALDGLLQDLRTVTPDNHDADAFLRPVSKAEVADYYDFIQNPMDLQTMQKKVKQKVYKSKKEFQYDLDLIWSNCFTYNAAEDHPLRKSATRLKSKAETLLKNITDRKERLELPMPDNHSLRSGTAKVNGINGHSVARPRPVAFTKSPSPAKLPSGPAPSRQQRRDTPFLESPAIVRTAEDMTAFLQLDRELDARLNNELTANAFSCLSLEEKLREYVVDSPDAGEDGGFMAMDVDVGGKRKLNGHADNRPRKRARATPIEKDVVDLWWDAVQSDAMIGNGIPTLRFASSEDPSDISPPASINDPPRKPEVRKGKKRKKRGSGPEAEKTLLYHMNNNIRTFHRMQNAYSKLSVLKEAIAADEAQQGGDSRPTFIQPPVLKDMDDHVDDRPWRPTASGLDLGEENSNDCLRWMSSKVLQHAGFHGTSKAALDVVVGVAADYLNSLGHTIRFLCDKYGNKMSPEEIILHSLFASGTAQVNELERYIKDDILRNGSRLVDLEKKLIHAYEDITTNEAWDDDALFRAEDEEDEEGEFVMGNFADSFGEDFLGLRELGIADEFGLASLTIPKKLLKGKTRAGLKGAEAAKPTEPPPPFPPPPPFIPLDSLHLDTQIGLLRPYYQQRVDSLSSSSIPPGPSSSATASILPHIPNGIGSTNPFPALPQAIPSMRSTPSTPIPIPEDAAPTAHTKIGPLGQIIKPSLTTATSKKKAAAKPKAASALGTLPAADEELLPADSPAATPIGIGPETPRKPKGTPAKKKKNTIEILPPVIIASA